MRNFKEDGTNHDLNWSSTPLSQWMVLEESEELLTGTKSEERDSVVRDEEFINTKYVPNQDLPSP